MLVATGLRVVKLAGFIFYLGFLLVFGKEWGDSETGRLGDGESWRIIDIIPALPVTHSPRHPLSPSQSQRPIFRVNNHIDDFADYIIISCIKIRSFVYR